MASLRRALDEIVATSPLLEKIVINKEVVIGPGGAIRLHLLAKDSLRQQGALEAIATLTPRVTPNSTTGDWRSVSHRHDDLAPDYFRVRLVKHAQLVDASIAIAMPETDNRALALTARLKSAADECLR